MKLESSPEAKAIAQTATKAPKPDKEDHYDMDLRHHIEMEVLEEIEHMEDRIFNASLQVKVSRSLGEARSFLFLFISYSFSFHIDCYKFDFDCLYSMIYLVGFSLFKKQSVVDW